MDILKYVSIISAIIFQLLCLVFIFFNPLLSLWCGILYGVSLISLIIILIVERIREKKEDDEHDYSDY